MKEWKAHLALLLTNLLYAGNYSIAKIVLPSKVQAFGFISIRVFAAAIIFFILHALLIRERVQVKDIPRFIACALFGVAINQLLFFYGLSFSQPINASLIMITTPIIVLILSVILLKELLDVWKVLGIGLGLFGASLIILGDFKSFNLVVEGGEIYIFLNACSFGLYLIIAKPLLAKYHPLTVLRWIFFFGALFVIPVGWKEFNEISWNTFEMVDYASVLYVILGATICTYMFNLYALQRLNASTVGSYIYSQPILAALIAIAIGKDSLNGQHLLAGGLIISGLLLVGYNRKKGIQKI